jgi:hypothetical protein
VSTAAATAAARISSNSSSKNQQLDDQQEQDLPSSAHVPSAVRFVAGAVPVLYPYHGIVLSSTYKYEAELHETGTTDSGQREGGGANDKTTVVT